MAYSDPASLRTSDASISEDARDNEAANGELSELGIINAAGVEPGAVFDGDIEKTPNTMNDKEIDPNVVDFDGPDDPIKAVNWSSKKKWSTALLISTFTFISPLASSMFAPGVPQLLDDFGKPFNLLGSFVVSVFVLGYAAGPIVIAPCSELYGRNIVYQVTAVLFIILNVACGLSTNLNMLIGFRFLAGVVGSAPVTIGGGSIADMFVQEQRGGAMAIWALGPLLGPVIGPIAGGFLATAKGWRWVFWILAMVSGAVSIAFLVFLRETYPSTILEKKTKRLRKETGNQELYSALNSGYTPAQLFKTSITRPLRFLFLSPIVAILSTMMALLYGYLYLVFTTLTEVFEDYYHFSSGIVGVTYVGIGVGCFLGLVVSGATSDRAMKKVKASGREMKPEHRLPMLIPAFFCMPVGLLIYGWSVDKHVFWFVPILGTSFIGFGLIGSFMPITTYLVDAFTIHASSAVAAATILRSILGALLPLAGPTMYAALGLGWGNTLLALIAVACLPTPFLLLKYGERIRTNPRFQVN